MRFQDEVGADDAPIQMDGAGLSLPLIAGLAIYQ
jgi:hypothetical protein